MDIQLRVEKNGNIISLMQDKNKDGKLQKPLKFNAKEIAVPGWIDEDDEQETTLTLEINEELTQAEAIAKPKEKPVKIPDSVKTAKETFATAAEKYGEIIDDSDIKTEDGKPVAIVAVNIEKWRSVFYANSSAENTKGKNKQFERARKALREVRKILNIKIIGETEYYCLRTNYADETLSGATLEALIKERQKEENKTERTGEIFKKETATDSAAEAHKASNNVEEEFPTQYSLESLRNLYERKYKNSDISFEKFIEIQRDLTPNESDRVYFNAHLKKLKNQTPAA